MNKTAIEWTDRTWNPVTGCLRGCPYCYARELAETRLSHIYPNGFKPTFWENRLYEPQKVKEPQKIFVCSMGDLFGKGVPDEWIARVMDDGISSSLHHSFQVLTKCPERIDCGDHNNNYPPNIWWGTSVESADYADRIEYLSTRHDAGDTTFVSFEPLLGPISADLSLINWIIIGARTNPLILPDKAWVGSLIGLARDCGCSVFMKNSLRGLGLPMIQEYPGGEE